MTEIIKVILQYHLAMVLQHLSQSTYKIKCEVNE